MIDWYSLLANSLWIVGLAILLARLSFASYWKAQPVQQRPSVRLDWAEALGLILFCLGLLLAADSLLERIAWAALAVASLAWSLWEARRRTTGNP